MSMRILQVSTSDLHGGAERVAWNLFQGYRQRGHVSELVVGNRHSDNPHVHVLPNEAERRRFLWWRFWQGVGKSLIPIQGKIKGAWRLGRSAQQLAEPRRTWNRWRGYEDFEHPATRHLLEWGADVVHLHNLHGGYFDLRCLPQLSAQYPTVWTLHDMWSFTGHCGHAFDCERWKMGCGSCPDLSIYPPLQRDGTAQNWGRKRRIYQQSRLFVCTPSQWLMDAVQQSVLTDGIVEARVIPNGVDLSVFCVGDRSAARAKLGLPLDADILLFTASSIRQNPFKDYATMQAALERVAQTTPQRKVIFIGLGEDAPSQILSDQVEIRLMPYQTDVGMIAAFYQAADVYLHAARADNFPNTVLEALACGLPVIASRVGGIPEQIREGQSGFLVSVGDSAEMADAILQLLGDESLRRNMGTFAAQDAQARFDVAQQIDEHLAWYASLLGRRGANAV